jgi:hypothetical protein
VLCDVKTVMQYCIYHTVMLTVCGHAVREDSLMSTVESVRTVCVHDGTDNHQHPLKDVMLVCVLVLVFLSDD